MIRVGLIGPGRAGQALVRLLPPAKYEVGPVFSRNFTSARRAVRLMRLGAPTASLDDFADCRVILIAVPDDAIAAAAQQLAEASFSFRGKIVFHTSGALDSSLLAPVRTRRAAVASLHPLQSFGRHVLSLAGIHFAVEGDEKALRWAQILVTDWHGKILRLKPGQKLLYHAAATFVSPLFTPLIQAAVVLMGHAGVGRKTAIQALKPLLLTTLENFTHSGRQSWTGPLARGDAGTIEKHVAALESADPVLARYYRWSALSALSLFDRHPELRRILEGAGITELPTI
jgi:predicted short-subunit dehydrogenase-like oxidoreductase (DUF2520 family)